MSATPQHYLEDDERIRTLNQIKFDIRDKTESSLEGKADIKTKSYEKWIEGIKQTIVELEKLVRFGDQQDMVEEAKELIENDVIEPYKTELADFMPETPSNEYDHALESDEAIIASGELKATYIDDLMELYGAVQRIGVDKPADDRFFSDYSGKV